MVKERVFGESVQGASHIRSGIECQDSFKKVLLTDDTVILAVADGHGSKSCPYSKTGSSIAVDVFCDVLKSLYEGNSETLEQFQTFLNREGETSVSKAIDAEWKKRVLDFHKENNREIEKLENGEDNLNSVYNQYGSTLLGLMIAKDFVFGFQLGDGDICFVNDNGLEMVIEPEKMLGVETHSLCRENSWEKAITVVRRISFCENLPAMFSLSTDGYANSYKSETEFHEAVKGYLPMLKEHGADAVSESLPEWLSETSQMGCGDDITMLVAYYEKEKTDTDTNLN